MTSTFVIDEECCDRIRTALEITDIEQDITAFVQRYGTGNRMPGKIVINYKISFTSENNSTINGLPSAQQPITTILTNPDEELKSVERQLQQLEVQSTTPKPLSGVTNTTDQSNGPFSTAIREVEQILNQEKPKQEDATPTMTPPASGEHEEHNPVAFAGNPSIAHEQHVDTTQQALPSTTAPKTTNQTDKKYKPMPNPAYSHIAASDSRPTSSLINSRNISPVDGNNVKDEDNDDKEAKEYQSRMPHPPPKDEKWVISSIRRPQQLPVRASNATMFDGTVSVKGSMIASPPLQSKDSINDTTLQHVPKVHRPAIPLTIDIPNSVKPQPDQALNAAQKVIAEGKRRSQQQSMNRNVMRGYITSQNEMLDDGGIRPAPWQNEYHSEGIVSNGNMNSYNRGVNMMSAPYAANINNGHQNYMPNMSGVRSSSTKPSDQVVPQQHEEENVNKKRFGKNKQYLETSGKSKESKTGRFSLGFFSNKKEKKKEKEAAAAAAAAAATSSSQQDHLQQQRPMSQQIVYQQSLTSQESSRNDLKGQYSNNSTHPVAQQSMTQAYIPDHTRFIGYAKAQWSFEATIEGEMSFFADEVLGIIRKQMDGWWEAERLGPVNAGQRGLIPGNYMLDNQPQP
ncbi:MAG: hypothetical protein EXX96DRAFT_481896 [Benjaminiella poitrasii]|nr:MAG: hypothetical protein EXX96DRAFT_481896 [Benjaminiella poitrasii]